MRDVSTVPFSRDNFSSTANNKNKHYISQICSLDRMLLVKIQKKHLAPNIHLVIFAKTLATFMGLIAIIKKIYL